MKRGHYVSLKKQNVLLAALLPLPKLHRLDENIGAVSVEFTPDDLRDIDFAASKITVQGARYPERLGRMTGR